MYTEETARQFLDAYCGLIGTLGRNPHVRIGNGSAVGDNEHSHLVNELSTSGPVNSAEYKLRQLVNSKANPLARLLSRQGVGPDSIVAVCFERGIPQILAILAILKAGGAFLPLDPDDPTFRKEMLIVDANANILLTTYSQRRDFDKALASKVIVSNTPKQYSFSR